MKNYIIPFFLLAFLCLPSANAQKKAAPKQVYDNTYDFGDLPCNVDPSSLIGKEIYFLVRNQMYAGGIPDKDTIFQEFYADQKTPVNSIIPQEYKDILKEAQDWTIIDFTQPKQMLNFNLDADIQTNVYKPVIATSPAKQIFLFTTYSALQNKLFKITNCIDTVNEDGTVCIFAFTMQDPDGVVVHWRVDSRKLHNYTCTFKSYIQYMHDTYVNKKVYIKKYSWVMPGYINPFDRKQYQTIPGQEWQCTDVTMLNDREKLFPRVALVLKNAEGISNGVTLNRTPDSLLCISQIWTEQELAQYNKDQSKRHDALLKTRKNKLLAKEKQHPGYKQAMMKKYGSIYGEPIANGQVMVGMTREMCKAAWGTTKNIVQGTVNGKQLEQWIYNDNQWIRFDDKGFVELFVD